MTEKKLDGRILGGDAKDKENGCEPENGKEQEMLAQIGRSAKRIEAPESLSPEKMLERCRNLKQENLGGAGRRAFAIRNPRLIGGLSAAAVLLICCISLSGIGGTWNNISSGRLKRAASSADMAAPAQAPMAAPAAGASESAMESAMESAVESEAQDAPVIERKNAGELYTLAESYSDVYERLDEIMEEVSYRKYSMNGVDGAAAGISADAGRVMEAAEAEGAVRELAQKQEAANDAGGYSKTNVQTFGIDESDLVKTDGEYLYLLRGSLISIVRAGKDKMEPVCELEVDAVGAAAEVRAMYVDGDRLIVLTQESRTDLKQKKESGEDVLYDIDYIDTDVVTSVLTYDIGRRENPVLLGEMTQDGSYVTSRKKGNMLYLFTDQYLLKDYGNDKEGAIPEVNARKIPADCIYIGDRGERALIISSVSIDKPEAVRDSVMILDGGSEIYMGGDSLYLYRGNYRGMSAATEIAKFSMADGYLNGEAATSVRGLVRDTFAINEKDNKLRVLTTDTSSGSDENCLFLLDERLKVTGKLTRIAVGERIYAARFLGDMAYFITYRNTDPLFAADLSDEKNPRLVGELKITGFSEYLHFWGEDKLLGLGYETDQTTGEQKGLKLVMFDMSDPYALKTLGSKVLQGASYSPALYDYKAVLASPGENLIGFVTERYESRRGLRRAYELYRWGGSGFERILAEELDGDYESDSYRGLYIGEQFYIACPEVVRCYDRADYELKQKLEL